MSQKISNWSEYNKSLINRGSLTFWISEDVLKVWGLNKKTSNAGRPEKYSDTAIKAVCRVRFFFHLSLRATEVFIGSLFKLMNITLSVPSYSRISRRMNRLDIDYRKLSNAKPKHLVIDTTGVKIYGDGEWHEKIHGECRRKKWKKMTLGICPDTYEIIFNVPSDDSIGDITLFRMGLEVVRRNVEKVLMDRAGDTHDTYKQAERQNIRIITPPRKGSRYRVGREKTARDDTVRLIYDLGNNKEAVKEWKRRTGYHRRSLVETAISRLKGMLGNQLKSRSLMNQHQEMMIKSLIINQINRLGLPVRS